MTGSGVVTLAMLAFTVAGPHGSDKETTEVKMMITTHRHICERKIRWQRSEAGSVRTIFRASLDQSKKSHGLLTFGHCSSYKMVRILRNIRSETMALENMQDHAPSNAFDLGGAGGADAVAAAVQDMMRF